MAQRALLEVFNRYAPDGQAKSILSSAVEYKLLADKENKSLKVQIRFPQLYPYARLQKIEGDIRAAYQLNYVEIEPIYPTELFDGSCVPDLIKELMRKGIVTKGFLDSYTVAEMTGDRLILEIPFSDGGVGLVCSAKTPELLEDIIRRAFGVSLHVEIRGNEEIYRQHQQAYEQDNEARMAALMKESEEQAAAAQRERLQQEAEEAALHPNLPGVNTLDTHELIFEKVDDAVYR
ncbi:MAG: hypothetical protein MJ175_06705, partial [Clostridia bacterium]|nr:hypothetical protein [Clostridia bacterium]